MSTSPLSDSMRRRLEKEEEAFGSMASTTSEDPFVSTPQPRHIMRHNNHQGREGSDHEDGINGNLGGQQQVPFEGDEVRKTHVSTL